MPPGIPNVEEMYIYELEWKNHTKRFYFGGPRGASMEFQKAIVEIEAERSEVVDWLEYVQMALEVFGRRGFARVEP